MRSPWSYFRVASVFTQERIDAIDAGLWTEIDPSRFDEEGERAYRGAVLAQYGLYVEMADRVSARRALANTFFLTLNTAIFAAIGVFWRDRPEASESVLAFPLLALVVQCLTWYWILRSYRQLNSAKFAVVGRIERGLPLAVYSDAEWKALGEGSDPELYWPLTVVESIVPALFGVAYVGAFVAVLLA